MEAGEETEVAEQKADLIYRCVCGVTVAARPWMVGRLAFCGHCRRATILPNRSGMEATEFQMPPLISLRLRMEPAKPQDWPRLLPIASDPKNYEFELGQPDTKGSLMRDLKRFRFPKGFRDFQTLTLLATRSSDGEVIGAVYVTVDGPNLTANLGVKIHHLYQGMGFGTEAVGEVVDFAFKGLGLHRVTAACDPANEPCWRMLESLGFRKEGVMKEWYMHPERGWLDCSLYARLENDPAPDGLIC